jgi:hypothetical protein
MSPHSLSERSLILLAALNRRGIKGPGALTLLKRYSQQHLALQIDYYDHEIVYRAALPEWAATPWLAHRIRHNAPAPKHMVLASKSLTQALRRIPARKLIPSNF